MTKLAEWLLGLSLLGATWVGLAFDPFGLRLPELGRELLWPLPAYLLVAFGCYSLATVGYRLATFNDCEAAAEELRSQIQEARKDLASKGFRF
ncbi:dolichol-phosphate mannosyltransferase subunit 3 [Heptranchias perlo]|uniref:dolichol-phosphate mannosyltransferase subunit 3 n=1 Tax=Heptranchias perlo TaxID=212740 RepID=UPI0035594CCF